jgi:large repetitive protein
MKDRLSHLIKYIRCACLILICTCRSTLPASITAQVPETPEIRYNWEQQFYGYLNGQRSLLFSHEMRNSKLAFVDINGNGLLDIFVGQENGEIAFFENKGTPKEPDFVLITQQYRAVFEVMRGGRKTRIRNVISVGARSAPALIDIDNDGDHDLFIGAEDGRIWFFENIGNNRIPVFKLVTSSYEGINVGPNAVPLFADINLNRKFDLMVGTVEGKVWLMTNEGTRKRADFRKKPPKLILALGLETHAAPALIDWDNNGVLDLLVGQKNGTLSLFRNQGTPFSPDWIFAENNFQLIDIGGESAPCIVDIDGDGDADVVIGSANPTVFLYENRKQDEQSLLWNISNNLFHFHKLVVTGQRASIAAGDLNGNGLLDLIVGEAKGNLNYYQNQGTATEPNWVLQTEELISVTGIENSVPTLGDINGDGLLDLLVGNKEGQVVLVLNQGTPQSPRWVISDQTYFQIDVGSNSVPRLIDLDGDGLLDLIIGNFAGRVIRYMNKGTQQAAVFRLASTRFGSAKTEQNAVPAFFDWRQNGSYDMILGGQNGKLQLLLSPGPKADENAIWESDEKALFAFDFYSHSHPYFMDYNGDGKPDLLVGNEHGDFRLLINQGTEGVGADPNAMVDNSIDPQTGSLVVEEVEGPLRIEIEDMIEDSDAEPREFFTIETLAPLTTRVEPVFVSTPIVLVRNQTITRSVPTFGDLDQDGSLDMLIGTAQGRVLYYQNVGSDTESVFQLISEDYLDTGRLKNTAPLLYDLDGDGDLDIILGTGDGRLLFYENRGSAEIPVYVLQSDFFNNIWLERDAKPAVADLDNDGLTDLLVGSFLGRLTFIHNASARFEVIRRDFQGIKVNLAAAPSFADINNNGKLELVVGSDNGRIHFFRNDHDNLSSPWRQDDQIAADIRFPQGSTPVLIDIDYDGDLDLVLGTESGRVLFFRNDAIIREELLPQS